MNDLREWLLSKLSDSVEIGGDDELILGFIHKLDALDDGEVWTGYVEGDQWLYVTGDPMEAKVTHWQHLPCPPLRGAA